jgi:putative transposase
MLAWNGGWLIAVDPRNTKRICGACGHVDAKNRIRQAQFQCGACGFEENADLNAARNILRAGHARFACSTPHDAESQAQRPARVCWQDLPRLV